MKMSKSINELCFEANEKEIVLSQSVFNSEHVDTIEITYDQIALLIEWLEEAIYKRANPPKENPLVGE